MNSNRINLYNLTLIGIVFFFFSLRSHCQDLKIQHKEVLKFKTIKRDLRKYLLKDRKRLLFIVSKKIYVIDLKNLRIDSILISSKVNINSIKFINDTVFSYKGNILYSSLPDSLKITFVKKKALNKNNINILNDFLNNRSYIPTYYYDSLSLANGYHKVFGFKKKYYYNWYVDKENKICYQILNNVVLAFSCETFDDLLNKSFIIPKINSLTSRVIYIHNTRYKKSVLFKNSFGSLVYFNGISSTILIKSSFNSIIGALYNKYYLIDKQLYHFHFVKSFLEIEKIIIPPLVRDSIAYPR